MKKYTLLMLVISVLVLASCKKENGKDGSVILSGIVVPGDAIGNDGDYYIDKTTGIMYGPKVGKVWGTGFSIVGPAGSTGLTGSQGVQGYNGNDGNANVKVYDKDISTATWTQVGSASSGHLELDIAAPVALTTASIAANTILVYVQSTDFSTWALVPFYTERNIRVTANITVGHLYLKRDQDDTPYTQSSFSKVRIVLIQNTTSMPISRTQFQTQVINNF